MYITIWAMVFDDFFLFDKIVVEVKAKTEGIPQEAVAQTLNYLKASGTNVGLIVNFGKSKLDIKDLSFSGSSSILRVISVIRG
jgi:GxxExxY protein